MNAVRKGGGFIFFFFFFSLFFFQHLASGDRVIGSRGISNGIFASR